MPSAPQQQQQQQHVSPDPPRQTPPQSPSPQSPSRAKNSPDIPQPPSYASPTSDTAEQPADLPLPTTSAPPIAPAPPSQPSPSRPPTVAASARRMPSAAPRRNQRSRLGRPPNINENSLMRRLECVMAVESGRMTMLTACQRYDISARTFYRWLRDKNRLIELTGFTEDDFRNSPPASWGPEPAEQHQDNPQQPQSQDTPPRHLDQPEHHEPQDNLPRLPAVQRSQPKQPTSSAPHTSSTSAPQTNQPLPNYMGMKRRFPKGSTSDPPRPSYSASPAQDRFSAASDPQAAYYAARRSFTKMPPTNASPRDPLTAERQAARTSTRMRRQDWRPGPPSTQRYEDDPQFAQPYSGSRSNSPHEPFKRRKLIRDTPAEDDGDHQMTNIEDAPQSSSPARREAANGAGFQPSSRDQPAGNGQQSRTAHRAGQNGADISEPVEEINGKHRIEVMMGRRKVIIAWYKGASAEDIKTSIARRFALLPGTQWALIDKNFDEIVISAGVPSGRYTLTVFS